VSVLEVPGAGLYYEIHGDGPLMVMIPGASGAAEGFRPVTRHWAASHTVALYDRRGFSRSVLDGPQDYQRRLEIDADDVRRLVEHLGDGPTIVFGASSGAVVALELLARHPGVVHTLVPFEPPAVKQLPDGKRWLDFFRVVYDIYRRDGIAPALKMFREHAFAESDRQAMVNAMDVTNNQTLANARYWFEHELRQYPAADLNLDALAAHADRIVLAVGRESAGYPCHDVNVELGKKLNRELLTLPGGHIGCITQPSAFAAELTSALAQ